MTKRTIISALAVLLIATLCAAPAVACPASTVLQYAEDAEGTILDSKLHSISDGYLTTKGIDPDSIEGEFISPYVRGTTAYDHQRALDWDRENRQWLAQQAALERAPKGDRDRGRVGGSGVGGSGVEGSGKDKIKDYKIVTQRPKNSNDHRIDTKSVAECVLDSIECGHHDQHFGDGQQGYLEAYPPPPASVSLGG